MIWFVIQLTNIALENLEPGNFSIVLQISQCNYLLIVSHPSAYGFQV